MRNSVVLVMAAVVWLVAPARGAERRLWTHEEVNAFTEGEKQNLSVSQQGVIRLASAKKVLMDDLGQAVFDVLSAHGAIYAATGNEGKVYRLKDGEKKVVLDVDEPWVLSLGQDARGGVYAGTGPGGKIYRETDQGEWKLFADLGVPYVWALVEDGKDGMLAATGDTGKVFRLDAAGKAETILNAEHGHVLCLARGEDGQAYAGSDEKGIVYRIPAKGAATVAYDAEEAEIRAIATGPNGVVYFGTADIGASSKEQDRKQAKEGIASELLQRMTGSLNAGLRGTPVQRGPERKSVTGKNSLYRLDPSGDVIRMWQFPGKAILAIAAEGNAVYVGTGFDGYVYRVDANQQCTEVGKLEKGEVLSLAFEQGGRLLVGTSNDGELLGMLDEYEKEGSFTSTALDAKVPSRWGEARWDAETPKGTSVEISTRSGNSEEPDATWSDWGKSLPDRDGSQVNSPPARFLQYRVRLVSKDVHASPEFRRLEIAYLGANLPPRITTFSITRVEEEDKASASTAKGGGSKGSQEGLSVGGGGRLQIVWGAEDPNNDDLEYTLSFRGEGETNWKTLAEEITDTKYVWDTTLVPDGIYELLLLVSDAPSNAAADAKEHQKTSSYFRVDNTPPVIEKLNAAVDKERTVRVTSAASDGKGRLRSAWYSVDGDPLEMVDAKDGITDGAREDFDFDVPGLAEGEHTLVLVVEDDGGNRAAGKQVVRVGAAQK